MSLEATQAVVFCGLDFVGLAGTSVPAWPLLRGTPKGIGGIATKSKTKGGGATPHACPLLNSTPKLKTNTTQNTTETEIKMQKNLKQTPKKTKLKTFLITATITTLHLITGCQTTDSKQKKEMAHVMTKQEILIDAVVAEREQTNVKGQISKSETLVKAEAHLMAALKALKQSNQALKEVMENEQY